MNNQTKEIIGSGIQALGTVTAAVGSTPIFFIKKEELHNLNIYGNVLQATGNGLQADAKELLSLGQLGNQIQAAGNSTVVAGLVIDFEKVTELKLHITGNWLQALGGVVEVADAIENDVGLIQSFIIIGNGLQAIGNSLQAIGAIYELETKDDKTGVSLIVKGSWIQAVGSIIAFLGAARKGMKQQEIEKNFTFRKGQKNTAQ
ncbi:DUF6944 family repetitive protein [Ectobacillus sp. sgz5001026]|uniref:DUF6944 family repetitive protein n=1 Tax=Ectobacillus sp. sgz5001026 TaxID=3242473 RepID=UPI0036D28444